MVMRNLEDTYLNTVLEIPISKCQLVCKAHEAFVCLCGMLDGARP